MRWQQLAAGDVISIPHATVGSRPRHYEILTISPVQPGRFERKGIIRWLDDGTEQGKTWQVTTHMMFTVVGGPKLAAAAGGVR